MSQTQRRIIKLESTAKKHVIKKLQLFEYDAAKGEYPPEKETYDTDRPVLRLILNRTQGQTDEHKNSA